MSAGLYKLCYKMYLCNNNFLAKRNYATDAIFKEILSSGLSQLQLNSQFLGSLLHLPHNGTQGFCQRMGSHGINFFLEDFFTLWTLALHETFWWDPSFVIFAPSARYALSFSPSLCSNSSPLIFQRVRTSMLAAIKEKIITIFTYFKFPQLLFTLHLIYQIFIYFLFVRLIRFKFTFFNIC